MAEGRQYNMRNPAVKRILQEVKEMQREACRDYMSMPLEEDIFEWQFAIHGPKDSEFEGGIYHGRITLPSEYPFKPPSFMLLTPSGRFEVQTKICLSISNHHPEHWQPSWSVRTALVALIAFMPTKPDGALGSLDYTKEERRQLAVKSRLAPPKFGSPARQQIIDQIHAAMLETAPPIPAALNSTTAGAGDDSNAGGQGNEQQQQQQEQQQSLEQQQAQPRLLQGEGLQAAASKASAPDNADTVPGEATAAVAGAAAAAAAASAAQEAAAAGSELQGDVVVPPRTPSPANRNALPSPHPSADRATSPEGQPPAMLAAGSIPGTPSSPTLAPAMGSTATATQTSPPVVATVAGAAGAAASAVGVVRRGAETGEVQVQGGGVEDRVLNTLAAAIVVAIVALLVRKFLRLYSPLDDLHLYEM